MPPPILEISPSIRPLQWTKEELSLAYCEYYDQALSRIRQSYYICVRDPHALPS